jgi:hypothetical protein
MSTVCANIHGGIIRYWKARTDVSSGMMEPIGSGCVQPAGCSKGETAIGPLGVGPLGPELRQSSGWSNA